MHSRPHCSGVYVHSPASNLHAAKLVTTDRVPPCCRQLGLFCEWARYLIGVSEFLLHNQPLSCHKTLETTSETITVLWCLAQWVAVWSLFETSRRRTSLNRFLHCCSCLASNRANSPSYRAATLQAVGVCDPWPTYVGLLLGVFAASAMIGAFKQVRCSFDFAADAIIWSQRLLFTFTCMHTECVQQDRRRWRRQQPVSHCHPDVRSISACLHDSVA